MSPDPPSHPRNSLTPLRSTANPSAERENGVLPAPLSWISCLPPSGLSVSITLIALPSPNCPAHTPNWWPQYLVDQGPNPGGAGVTSPLDDGFSSSDLNTGAALEARTL